jgi:glycosyltransferase involved in cell wall biosynthesis
VSGRDPLYGLLDPVIRHDPDGVSDELAHQYVDLVGPVCPDVIAAAEESTNDLVAITPYLFWPAVHGAPRLGRRVIFHGAAHDEAELHLRIMRPVYSSVGGFAFNSFAERDLVERMFPVAHLPSSVIGNAVVERSGDPAMARAALGLGPEEPFVLCVGRVERGKGAHALADMWRLYRRRHRGAPRLVFLGPVNEALEGDDDIVVAGRRSEEEKWGALRAADLVVTPSAFESFSLVVVEAWLAGRAVVVNSRCLATVEACRRSGGGLWFADYGTFEVLMERLLGDADLRAALASSGERYARRLFDWDAIVSRYATLSERILASRPAP